MRPIPLSAAFFCLPLLLVMLAGCASLDDAGPVHSVYRPASGKAHYSRVIYVTTRARDTKNPNSFSTLWDDQPHCGMAETVVPAAPMPDQDVPWGYIQKLHPDACGTRSGPFAAVVAHIKQLAKIQNCDSVFLFVHGFNTSFDSAVLRAAQIGNDARTGCVVAAFSWPGGEKLTGYIADVERSTYARPVLVALLRALADSGLKVSVLGHSMGARLSLSALAAMKYVQSPPQAPLVGQLVLAAADVGDAATDSDTLHLIRAAAPFVGRITVYGSHNDAVLKVSQNSHAGVARLGQILDPALAEEAGGTIDIIDASDVPADSTGHSYYAMSFEAIADIAAALRGVPLRARIADGRLSAGSPPVLSTDRKPRLITRLMREIAPAIP